MSLVGALAIFGTTQYAELNRTRLVLDELGAEYNRLTNEHEQLLSFMNLTEKMMIITNEDRLKIFLVSKYNSYSCPLAVIYSSLSNSTLELYLWPITPKGNELYVPLSVQRGNALRKEEATEVRQFHVLNWSGPLPAAPVIFNVNATQPGLYSVPLTKEGWYTISIVGPVGHGLQTFHVDGNPSLTGVEGTTIRIELVFYVHYMGKRIPFAVSKFDVYV